MSVSGMAKWLAGAAIAAIAALVGLCSGASFWACITIFLLGALSEKVLESKS